VNDDHELTMVVHEGQAVQYLVTHAFHRRLRKRFCPQHRQTQLNISNQTSLCQS